MDFRPIFITAITIIFVLAGIGIITLLIKPEISNIQGDVSNPLSAQQEEPKRENPESASKITAQASSATPEENQYSTNYGQEAYSCPEGSKTVQSCEAQDSPVCGWYDLGAANPVQCEWGPCVRGAFPNSCEACRTENIIFWTDGDCPLHG